MTILVLRSKMYEIARFSNEEFEELFNRIMNLEEKIEYWINKSNKDLVVETRFSYNIEDGIWEGEVEVRDAKETK